MFRFLQFLWEISWKHIVIATIAGLMSGTANALFISLINQSVNRAAVPNALVYFAILASFIIISSLLAQVMLIYLSQNAIYQLRLKLSNSILSSPLQHLEHLGENRVLVTLTDDVRSLTHAVSCIPNLCIDFATVIGCLAYIGWLSGIIFALTVGSAALAIWCVQTQLGRAKHLFTSAREEEDTLLKHFQAITKGTKELKLHRSRRQEFMSEHLQGTAMSLRKKNTTAQKSFTLANSFGQVTQFISLGFIIFVLPVLMHVPRPLLATYMLTSTFLAMPMQNLLSRMPDLMRGNIALRKIERMKLSLSNLSETESEITTELQPQCRIDLHYASYLYHPEMEAPEPMHPEDERAFMPMPAHHNNGGPPMHPPMDEKGFLLGPISITLKPGELTFITGGNGSGKSTLAKLLTGLYVPQQGEVYLNGTLITDYNREWYRQHFSAIFTDFYLFDRYLGFNQMNNLDQEVERYLRQLQIAHKVQVKNGVLSTTRLSQGQQKRLALLTAYLEDRPVYVFDEWASDQEPLFRELFYKEILFKLKERGKTVVVITHDDRYFHLADHMIKLDYGKVESDQKLLSPTLQRPS